MQTALSSLILLLGFPGGWDGQDSACSAGDPGLIPGSGRSPGEGNGYPRQYSCLENLQGQRSLEGYSPWGHKELDTTEQLLSLFLRGSSSCPHLCPSLRFLAPAWWSSQREPCFLPGSGRAATWLLGWDRHLGHELPLTLPSNRLSASSPLHSGAPGIINSWAFLRSLGTMHLPLVAFPSRHWVSAFFLTLFVNNRTLLTFLICCSQKSQSYLALLFFFFFFIFCNIFSSLILLLPFYQALGGVKINTCVFVSEVHPWNVNNNPALRSHLEDSHAGAWDGIWMCLQFQFSSAAQSDCDPVDCSMPGFRVHHYLPVLAQTHVHQVGDAIQPSHLLSSPSPAFHLSQHQGLF